MIEIKGVSKSFGGVRALDNVSFTVRDGEIVGYVGLNGAGKTTTMRIAVGVLYPDSGDVLIDGLSIIRDKRRASMRVGWVPESPVFEPDARALDYMVYLAGYYGVSSSDARSMARRLLEEVGLGDAMHRRLKEYSYGMRKRFALAVSMMSNPSNYLFDEVLNGLDPQGIQFFRNLAVKLRGEGCTVLFSSHILSEVENLADRVVFIHRGRIVGEMSMEEVRGMATPSLLIKTDRVDEHLLEVLRAYGDVRVEGGAVIIGNPSGESSEIVDRLVGEGYKVVEVRRREASLEEVFFRIIGEKG